jgi:hypothetical protein
MKTRAMNSEISKAPMNITRTHNGPSRDIPAAFIARLCDRRAAPMKKK